jgi:hypothetical protein
LWAPGLALAARRTESGENEGERASDQCNPMTQKYNDDLLLTPADRSLAAEAFRGLFPVLDFPELRSLFKTHDELANGAKRARRRLGLAAIVAGVIALLAASADPLYHDLPAPWPAVIGGAAGALGICSILIGSFGIFDARSKRTWLDNRLMTERLRQFQFQTLVYRAPSVLASVASAAAAAVFQEQRRPWLAVFELSHNAHLSARLRQVLDDDAEEYFLLHQPTGPESQFPPHHPDLEILFSVYRELRLEHQIQYANARLGRDEPLVSSAVRQHEILRTVSLVSIFVVLLAEVAIAFSIVPHWGTLVRSAWLHVAVLWFAVAALGARAFEEGLQPGREIERYSRYRATMQHLETQFDGASDPAEKFRVMRETERLVYQEMRGFLRTHEEARFLV